MTRIAVAAANITIIVGFWVAAVYLTVKVLRKVRKKNAR